ncbi:MAG: outer membrane lipoprotein-sorting protein [Thauera sp.]|nr:outer membrane lipoprotein-sorting protein [Thauera sp.]
MKVFQAQGRRGFFNAVVRALACLGAGLLIGSAAQADEAGLALAQRVYDRADGKDASSVVTMSLIAEGREARERSMVLYRASATDGEVSTLIRFTGPADIAGTGLLTLDEADGESNQWIYLPAMQRVRRVDSNRKGGRFVNSDYYFEDLRDRKPTMDTHRVIGQETIAGVACDVLESVPVEAGNSVYLRRVSWIDPASLLPLRVDFFEKDAEQPSKRLEVVVRDQVQGYWTVMDSTMSDLRSGHRTRLVVERIAYDRGLPTRLFSSKALEDERGEKEFRP